MDNPGFVSDNFDTLRTLNEKERSLLVSELGIIVITISLNDLIQEELRAAYHGKNYKEFVKLLYRTGYKNTQLNDEDSASSLWNSFGFQKFKTSRNLIFERDQDENLFEEILRTPGAGNSKFINMIWTECELWRQRDILVASNPKGKQPIDYVLESNDDENLFAFLVFDFKGESDVVTKANKKYFLKLKNEQYKSKTGESLFQKFYSIFDDKCDDICLNILDKLLQEMSQITDIKSETAIDAVVKMENEIHRRKILKLLMTYWKTDSEEYDHYKAILSNMSPYYKLILTLKERNEDEFEELFPKYLQTMKEMHGEVRYESFVRNDCNSLLEFALQNSQRRAINIVISCPVIDANKVFIKSDDSSFDSQNAHYIMSKLLEKGYYLGHGDEEQRVPSDWISAQVFEDFLDSRVSEDGEKFLSGTFLNYRSFKFI